MLLIDKLIVTWAVLFFVICGCGMAFSDQPKYSRIIVRTAALWVAVFLFFILFDVWSK